VDVSYCSTAASEGIQSAAVIVRGSGDRRRRWRWSERGMCLVQTAFYCNRGCFSTNSAVGSMEPSGSPPRQLPLRYWSELHKQVCILWHCHHWGRAALCPYHAPLQAGIVIPPAYHVGCRGRYGTRWSSSRISMVTTDDDDDHLLIPRSCDRTYFVSVKFERKALVDPSKVVLAPSWLRVLY